MYTAKCSYLRYNQLSVDSTAMHLLVETALSTFASLSKREFILSHEKCHCTCVLRILTGLPLRLFAGISSDGKSSTSSKLPSTLTVLFCNKSRWVRYKFAQFHLTSLEDRKVRFPNSLFDESGSIDSPSWNPETNKRLNQEYWRSSAKEALIQVFSKYASPSVHGINMRKKSKVLAHLPSENCSRAWATLFLQRYFWDYRNSISVGAHNTELYEANPQNTIESVK